MRERDIEKYLVDKIRNAGGKAYKFVSHGNAGVPDRLVLLPGGKIIFVELKALGREPTPLQLVQHRRIRNLGFKVLVIDNKQAVDDLINEISVT
ncbi:VRR-NUC domain-containing protein [Clostridium sp. WILCCON 0269]|uniref:VRR-NUC domain-containing protein n=1 Tax=Candidatus Clostridium eludens TaxID=3381663 RepID=A0ABW8SNQ9_9CLOT